MAGSPPTREKGVPSGFSVHIDEKKGEESVYYCLIDGLSLKDIEYLAFMGDYLLERGMIKINHPEHTIPFAINHLLSTIRAQIMEAERPLRSSG